MAKSRVTGLLQQNPKREPIVLSNGNLRLSFDSATGALCALSSPSLGWDILDRPELGRSFRLLVPLGEEKRNNSVFGERQALSSSSLSPDARRLVLVWDGVTSENTGLLDIRVTLTVSLEDEEVVFLPEIENHCPYPVESVYCPYLGDVAHPEGDAWFRSFYWNYATATEKDVWPFFDNERRHCHVDYPTQFTANATSGCVPTSPFILLRSERVGLYCGVRSNIHDPVAWHLELRPGCASSLDYRVPDAREIAGKPVHTLFAAIHEPYVLPGETRTLTPIALKAFEGTWHKGVDIYKAWLESWMVPRTPPAWVSEPHSWQQLQVNSPEDELRLRYRDLPQVAAECARHGVRAIQLVGWNHGGQDQGNPSHDTDPRLGTFEELKEAIAECRRLGVKVILFAKFTWADRATEWYRSELHRYAIRDPYGDDYVYNGYEYMTPTQLLNINTKRFIPMCFLSDGYRKVAQKEFHKLVDLGADGMLYDEGQSHAPSVVCFDTLHGHRYAAPTYQNDILLIEEFRELPGVPEDFLMSGEALYDWTFVQYQLSYHRSESRSHIPLSRYILPSVRFMTAITGFRDRNMVNQSLLCGYILSYEPYMFKGRLSDFPDTVAYGMRMDALRTELRRWFWDGEFRHTCGASVRTTDGKPLDSYGVFRAIDGTLGVAVANYDPRPVIVEVRLDEGILSMYRLVDDPRWRPSGTIELPAESAAVVVP